MKIKSRTSSSKKPIIVVVCIVLAALCAVALFLYLPRIADKKLSKTDNTTTTNVIDYSAPTDEQSNATTDQQQAPDNSTMTAVDVRLTSINQVSGTLQIRTLITPIIGNATCTLTLSKVGSSTITQTAPTQNLSSSSTCQGFDVPIASMSTGKWTISISVTNASSEGSTSGEVVIQ